MIRFKRIRWKNLLSTGNSFTELDLDPGENVLVVGKNGSGKSTVLDALCIACFNKPYRNINRPQILNSLNKKEMVVEVEFDDGHRDYKVVRGINPNVFEIWIDGNLLEQDASVKDYQARLEKILRMNLTSFKQICILGSRNFIPFMRLPAGDRRKIIDDFLGVSLITSMGKVARERLQSAEKKVSEIDEAIRLARSKRDMTRSFVKKMEEDTSDRIRDIERRILEAERVVEEAERSLRSASEVVSKIRDQVSSFPSDLRSMITKAVSDKSEAETLEKQAIQKAKFYDKDTCSSCRQRIDEHFKEVQVRELLEIAASHRKKAEEVRSRLEDLNKKESELRAVEKELNDAVRLESEFKSAVQSGRREVESLRKSMEGEANKGDVQAERAKLSQYEEVLVQLEAKKATLADGLSVIRDAIEMLKDTGIKAQIIRKYCPIINHHVNKYLALLDFFVSMEFNENFEESIKSRHRDEFSYESFSEGEKMRIDLALLFTWRAVAKMKNSASTNLLILDEVFDASLDSDGVEYLLKMIRDVLGSPGIFVISHQGDVLADKFNRIIRFEKSKGFSRMV